MKNFLNYLHALFTRHNGLRKTGKYYVQYDASTRSSAMPYGNAYDYQKMFGGTIHEVK